MVVTLWLWIFFFLLLCFPLRVQYRKSAVEVGTESYEFYEDEHFALIAL